MNLTFAVGLKIWCLNTLKCDAGKTHSCINICFYFVYQVLHKRAGRGVSDQGVYRCIIRNPMGALISRPAFLRLACKLIEISLYFKKFS